MCRIHIFKKSFSRSVAFKMTEEIKIRISFIKDLKLFFCITKHCLLFHTVLCWAEFLLKKIPFKTDSLKLWKFASKLPMASRIYSLKCCRLNALSPFNGIQWDLWFTWHRQWAHHLIPNNSVACRPSLWLIDCFLWEKSTLPHVNTRSSEVKGRCFTCGAEDTRVLCGALVIA